MFVPGADLAVPELQTPDISAADDKPQSKAGRIHPVNTRRHAGNFKRSILLNSSLKRRQERPLQQDSLRRHFARKNLVPHEPATDLREARRFRRTQDYRELTDYPREN